MKQQKVQEHSFTLMKTRELRDGPRVNLCSVEKYLDNHNENGIKEERRKNPESISVHYRTATAV